MLHAAITRSVATRQVSKRLRKTARILSVPDIKERMQVIGFVPAPSTPEDYDQIRREQIATLSQLAREAACAPSETARVGAITGIPEQTTIVCVSQLFRSCQEARGCRSPLSVFMVQHVVLLLTLYRSSCSTGSCRPYQFRRSLPLYICAYVASCRSRRRIGSWIGRQHSSIVSERSHGERIRNAGRFSATGDSGRPPC